MLKNKSKLSTIIILVITLILAGVAIFTAIRLYQLRTQPVAPNVPSSKPAAAGQTCGGITGAGCASDEECIYDNGTSIAPSADATGICQPSAKTADNCLLTFTVSSNESTTQCNSACTSDAGCPTNTKCNIASGQTSGFCRNPSCSSETDCVCGTSSGTPTASPTPTGSPTHSPTASAVSTPISCGSTCTSNSNCQSSMICYNGICRNPSCTSETDCTCSTTTSTSNPSLPNTGSSWPSVFGMGLGVFVVLASLLLAL